MNVNSVSGKNWKFKEFDYNDLKELSEKHSLSEIVSKLVAIRKNNISDINLYLNPTIKSLLPNPYRKAKPSVSLVIMMLMEHLLLLYYLDISYL